MLHRIFFFENIWPFLADLAMNSFVKTLDKLFFVENFGQ